VRDVAVLGGAAEAARLGQFLEVFQPFDLHGASGLLW
jgi:hypothetical protein